MNTDARRKASATYHAKRKAEGQRKVTLWLSPEAMAALEGAKAVHGSKDAAADHAIRLLRGDAPSAPAKAEPKASAKPFKTRLKGEWKAP